VLAQLSKYASASSHLRELALEKRAGLLGAAAKGAWGVGKGLGALAMRKPGATLGVGLGAGLGVVGAKGKYDQYKAGFNPEVQKSMMGQPPTPPGA
jgi:ABC-type thiamin/hydroxymethylpyrimidine transport system permease subunit